ncbi:hypothetical protein OK006_10975 [Actinobacteria bacterium OK006]|nr:hypothetical protein OK006_10975 [Actinobacteria bacterium OK006]
MMFSGLFPLVLEDVADEGEQILLRACTRLGMAACPACQAPSGRVHCYHLRVVAELPVYGRRKVVRVRVRRLVCLTRDCRHGLRRRSRGPSHASALLHSRIRHGRLCAERVEPGRRRVDTGAFRCARCAPTAWGQYGRGARPQTGRQGMGGPAPVRTPRGTASTPRRGEAPVAGIGLQIWPRDYQHGKRKTIAQYTPPSTVNYPTTRAFTRPRTNTAQASWRVPA